MYEFNHINTNERRLNMKNLKLIVISLLAGTHSVGIAGAVGTIRDIMDGTILTIAPITTISMVTIILVT